ncbi:FAD-dependent monooxygenase [Streptomyces xanthophaeus]|nr:FAD-dependent monooxygenase [Streptomyces xanthophaeus]
MNRNTPRARATDHHHTTDILIVGAGPTGLMLGCLLRHHGSTATAPSSNSATTSTPAPGRSWCTRPDSKSWTPSTCAPPSKPRAYATPASTSTPTTRPSSPWTSADSTPPSPTT